MSSYGTKNPTNISRANLMQLKNHGGLAMINLETFIKSLHINWIKTLTGDRDPLWKECNTCLIKYPGKLLLYGSQWPKCIAASTTNIFWREILYSWAEYLNAYQKDLEPKEKACSLFWYNPNISKVNLFLPHWWKKTLLSFLIC